MKEYNINCVGKPCILLLDEMDHCVVHLLSNYIGPFHNASYIGPSYTAHLYDGFYNGLLLLEATVIECCMLSIKSSSMYICNVLTVLSFRFF